MGGDRTQGPGAAGQADQLPQLLALGCYSGLFWAKFVDWTTFATCAIIVSAPHIAFCVLFRCRSALFHGMAQGWSPGGQWAFSHSQT